MGIFKKLLQEAQEAGDLEFEERFRQEYLAHYSTREVPEELLAAEARCPDIKFVKSCREFFERRGFLSDAQKNALRYSGTPNRRRNYEYGYEPQPISRSHGPVCVCDECM